MENIIRRRISELLKEIEATPNSISDNPTEQRKLNRQINEGKTITVDVISKILERVPDVSSEWLLRGKGEMIKTETSPINVDGDLNIMDMERKIKRLEASLDALIEKNEKLEAELAEYKAREIQSKGIA